MPHQLTGSLAGRRTFLGALLGAGAVALTSCVADPSSPRSPAATAPSGTTEPPVAAPSSSATPTPTASATAAPGQAEMVSHYAGKPAGSFGLQVPGIQLGLPRGTLGAALSFDACGGQHGEGYDAKLIAVLRKYEAPATLFVNSRWARANVSLMRELIADPLFEIANHGTTHAPLTSRGQSAYGIPGTTSIATAYDEVMGNQRYLADTFGLEAKFFRSGTAHMDELGADLCRKVGLVPMNFTINLDAGATFPAATVADQMMLLGAGDVGIGHFNRPTSGTAAGVGRALPGLLEQLESKDLRLLRLSEAFA